MIRYSCSYCGLELNLIDIGKHFRQDHFNLKVSVKKCNCDCHNRNYWICDICQNNHIMEVQEIG